MASIVLSSVGSSVGNSFLSGIGGRVGSLFGRQGGRLLDQTIGLSAAPKDGPQLENLRVHDSRYGIGIPLAFGRVRVAGNVIWGSGLIESSHSSILSGGKGGSLGLGSSRTTYTYSIHCAIAICAGPIGGIQTIWADSKIIYQNGVWNSGVVASATFYNGTTTQNPDPFLQSMIGSSQVPAYRGTAYFVLESLQLGTFGNRLPNLTFEILPPDTSAQPVWLGSVDALISQTPVVVRNKGMMPLVVEGSSVNARKMLVGGYVSNGATATFSVVEYDVTGSTLVELARLHSASFTVSDIGDHSWALAPDGRFVAMCLQDIVASPALRFVIYDSEAQQFGTVLSLGVPLSGDTRQVAWLDAQHFVVPDTSGGHRGVQVFARAGLNIISLGFYDVWGAGSATSRQPLFYAQFTPMVGGLLYYTTDYTPNFTALYACAIVWQNNHLIVGTPYTVASGISVGTGSGGMAALLATGENEWTLFRGTVVDMRMMSFQPALGSAVITRPWQHLTNTSFTTGTSTHPIVYGNQIVVVQRCALDNSYRLSEIALNSGSFTLTTDGAVVSGFSAPEVDFGAAMIDGARLLVMALGGFNSDIAQLAIIQRRNTGSDLATIVTALLNRAGYASGDYDVSALQTTPVDGYVLKNAMSAASAIAPLQVYDPFDLVERDARLVAVKHTNTAVLSIPSSEWRAVAKPTIEPAPSYEQTRTQELDLPAEITVDYLDASRDYEIGSQRARRIATRGAKASAKIHLPLVCLATKAKQIAETRLYNAWAERDHIKLAWSRRWLGVDIGDVINLGTRLMRVAHIQQAGGFLNVEGALVPSALITSTATADSGTATAHTDNTPVSSILYLMDLPLLRSGDDQAGVYVAISGNDGWNGASMWRAPDDVNFSNLASFSAPAVAGIATSALPDSSPCYMDSINTVTVQLLQGTLAGCGDADLLNGTNVALLGNEILQFQTAVLTGPGCYTLSNLLRGRRATESRTSTHSIGENFVMLTQATAQFIPALLTDRNRLYNFRALTNGQSLGDVYDTNFTYQLTTLQPFAPTHVAGSRSGGTGSDLTITWTRRARINADWIDYVDVPLDEPTELYDVEIMNGVSALRTFSSVLTTTVTYSAAQQSADWGTVPAAFTVNVYQISARYGRGQKATTTI